MIRKNSLPNLKNVGGKSAVVDSSKLSHSHHRYTHAKSDPAHCIVPGLFQALKRGVREGCNHSVTHQYGDVTLAFRCFEPLGADDLRVLQGLLAIGSPISNPVVLTADSSEENLDHREIRKNLLLTESSLHLETLVVQGSYYQLAKEIGLGTEGSKTFRRIRKSIERLCSVSIIAKYKDGRHHGYQLIGGYASSETRKEIHVVLNPRLTAAILGKRMDASGSHTRIEMDEVRRIQGDATRVLHQYLCAIISPGETKELLASTMRAHVWLQIPTPQKNKPAYAKWMERVKKQHQRIRLAMDELNRLGWHCTQITDNRPNKVQKHYIKWKVSRPAILEAEKIADVDVLSDLIQPCSAPSTPDPVDHTATSVTEVQLKVITPDTNNPPDLSEIAKNNPAKALREFGDKLNDEQFSLAVGKQPVAAIKNCLDRLTDEQFSIAATRAPEAAMRYALERLNEDQLASLSVKDPAAAIRFALRRLSPDLFISAAGATEWPIGNPEVSDAQLDAWFSQNPNTALKHYLDITGKTFPTFESLLLALSPIRMASCSLARPNDSLKIAQSLPPVLLAEVAHKNPALAIKLAAKHMPPELMDECVLLAPAAAITHRFETLDSDQRKWCLKKSPWTAAALHSRDLTIEERESCRDATAKAIPEKLDLILQESPSAALQFARPFLTTQQRLYCEDALRYLS